tara:strand:- start:104546 stop:104665 length:120 start_codon:yes stop_codon:yes gene_type:complete
LDGNEHLRVKSGVNIFFIDEIHIGNLVEKRVEKKGELTF